VGCGAQGHAVGRPQGRTHGRDSLGVEVTEVVHVGLSATPILPRDDGATLAVRDDDRTKLVAGEVAQGHAIGCPHEHTARRDPLGVDVVVGGMAAVHAPVGPCDDGAAGVVRDDCGHVLGVGREAQGLAIRRPQGCATCRDPLGVDVPVGAVTPILPCDDGATRAVRDDRGSALQADGGAESCASNRPQGRAVSRDALGEDADVFTQVARPVSIVHPGDDRATRAVRDVDR
jgi:hypothetical protein